MKKQFFLLYAFIAFTFCSNFIQAQIKFTPTNHSSFDSGNLKNDYLVYHFIKKDKQGNIAPWYNSKPGIAYNHAINLLWNFWDTMRLDKNGLPYYMNHQIWEADYDDNRGLAGSQFEATLSSWYLLYCYTGNQRVVDNMSFITDYYLTHSLSDKDAQWPNLPYPYNTLVYSGVYDGDMILGKDYTQPDKAGSFGYELVSLYKMTGNKRYLTAAINIANTLAKQTKVGDNDYSPLPFKVNAVTGELGKLFDNEVKTKQTNHSGYSTNWSGTLRLFQELQGLHIGDTLSYKNSFNIILNWMKTYPLKTNKWGPFFEDISGWSDTQINAITFAQFMMKNTDLFPNWKEEVNGIFNWVYCVLGNKKWEKYGVTVVNEQTAYKVEGNSHTARQAAVELFYSQLSGDTSRKVNAIRQLNWATYMIDNNGRNQYPNIQIWLIDGYSDYIRHYLRAMATLPTLAPDNEDHLLNSTATIKEIEYFPNFKYGIWSIAMSETDLIKGKKVFPKILYTTNSKSGTETLRLIKKPVSITVNKNIIAETNNSLVEGWIWEPLENGGILTLHHTSGEQMAISY